MKNLILLLLVVSSLKVSAQWVGDSYGFLGGTVNGFGIVNNKLFAATNPSGIFLHENTSNWIQKNNGLTNTQIYSVVSSNGTLYVGTSNGGIFVSDNEGENWISKSITSTTSPIYSLGVNGQTILAGTLSGIFISTNGGDSWNQSTNGFPNSPVTSILFVGNEIFAATYGAGIYYSNDSGSSWVAKNNGLNVLALWSITIHSNILFAGSNSGLYYSTDNGNTWNSIPVYNTRPFKSLLSYGGVIFAGKSEPANTNFLFSTNNGVTWQTASDGLTTSVTEIIAIAVNNGYIYVSTPTAAYKIHKRPLSEIVTSVHEENLSPFEFKLSQNYPNPFNPSTKISWQSPAGGYTTLKVYDVLGNEVATLVDEYKDAGNHEIIVDTRQLAVGNSIASGAYFYRLKVGEFIQTRKMILSK